MRIPLWPGVRLSLFVPQNPDAVQVRMAFHRKPPRVLRVASMRGWMLLLVRYDWRDGGKPESLSEERALRDQLSLLRQGAIERSAMLEECRDLLESAGHNGAHGDDWPEVAPALRALVAERDRLAALVEAQRRVIERQAREALAKESPTPSRRRRPRAPKGT